MIKNISLIVNPASGKDYPILSVANRFFKKNKISWQPYVTKRKNDAEKFARQSIQLGVDALVVYGGDGTVMEVAHGVSLSNTPVSIIPGGTANIVSKEMGIPQDPLEALSLLLEAKHEVKTIDTFSVNGHSYFIRVNVGLFADMVKKTKRASKTRFGSWAYALAVLKNLDPVVSKYSLRIGSEKHEIMGVGLMITNIGSIGLGDRSLFPMIDATDGQLDVVILPRSDVLSWASLAQGTFLQNSEVNLPHFQAQSIEVSIEPSQTIILDDELYHEPSISVQVQPSTLSFIVPKSL